MVTNMVIIMVTERVRATEIRIRIDISFKIKQGDAAIAASPQYKSFKVRDRDIHRN